MKSLFAVLFSACATAALFAAPTIKEKSVTFGFNAASRLVTIDYELVNGPAIVTVDVQTNRTGATTADAADWVSIGGEHLQTLTSDLPLNQPVSGDGPHKAFWRPDEDWPDHDVANGAIRAVVTAWSESDPPNYLVVDLVNPSNRWFYLDASFLPKGGLTNDYYRTDAMVMSRIPARGVKWVMGSPSTEVGHDADDERQHYVMLTNDYYMAVFELTFGQVRKFAGTELASMDGGRSYYINCFNCNGQKSYQYYTHMWGDDEDVYPSTTTTNLYPVNEMKHSFLRGASPVDWPMTRHYVNPESFCGLLRAKTGVDFDLPTEAQWEFAARAGTGTATYNGSFVKVSATVDAFKDVLDPIAWYDGHDGMKEGNPRCHVVGRLKPNAFGLYDMFGNMDECCLDYYDEDYGGIAGIREITYEPEGPISTAERVYRGGYCGYSYSTLRAAARHTKQYWFGARLICPVGLQYPASEKAEPVQ